MPSNQLEALLDCGCGCAESCCVAALKRTTRVEVTVAGWIAESDDLWNIDTTRVLEWDELLQRLIYYGEGGPTRGARPVVAAFYNELMSAIFFCETSTLMALQIGTAYNEIINAFTCSLYLNCETWDMTKTIEFSNCFEFFDSFPLPLAEPYTYLFDPNNCVPCISEGEVTESEDKIRICSTACVVPGDTSYRGYNYLIRIIL